MELQVSNLSAGCPTGCDTCSLDNNNVVTCTSSGCSAGWFYAKDGKCIGQSNTIYLYSRLYSRYM